MKRVLLSVGFVALAAACKKDEKKEEVPVVAPTSSVTAEPAATLAPEPTQTATAKAAVVAKPDAGAALVEADFVDDAVKDITDTNMEAELGALEKEIGK